MIANARGYRRRRITRWPESLPSWLTWAAWDEVTATAGVAPSSETAATEAAKIKGNRKKPEWRDMTALERKAVAAYQTCYTPPYSFDRRFRKALASQLGADGKGKITDKQAHWLWFYTQKHRRQVSDKEVLREAERRAKIATASAPATASASAKTKG